MELCKQINGALAEPCDLDEALIHELSYTARGDLCPMAAVIGGITAQEVMKVCLQLLSFYISLFFNHFTIKGWTQPALYILLTFTIMIDFCQLHLWTCWCVFCLMDTIRNQGSFMYIQH